MTAPASRAAPATRAEASAWPECGRAAKRSAASCGWRRVKRRGRGAQRAARRCGLALRGYRWWKRRGRAAARRVRGARAMSLRLLLADDHAIVRQGVRQLLIDRGVADEVIEAETGSQALASLDKHAFDTILLDISLPGMNGVEALKPMQRKAPRRPGLVFSGYREDEEAVPAVMVGWAGCLSRSVGRG